MLVQFLVPSPVWQNWYFYPQSHAEIPSGRLDFYKVSFVVGFCLSQHFLGFPDHSLEGLGQTYWLLLVLQSMPMSLCLLLAAQVVRLLRGPLT